jgi:hypothetical protein
MSAPYILRRDGHDYQAPDLETLRAWAQAGRVLPGDMVYSPVYSSWYRASDLRGLRDVLPTADAGAPPVVAQAVTQCFWLRKGDQNYSAESLEVILQWASDGIIDPDDYIFHPSYGKWFQAGDSPQLVSRFPPHIKHSPPFLPASADPMASAELRTQLDPLQGPGLQPAPEQRPVVAEPARAAAPVVPATPARPAAALESADSMAKTVMDMQAIRVDMLRPAPARPATPAPAPVAAPVLDAGISALDGAATGDLGGVTAEQPGSRAPAPAAGAGAASGGWQHPAGGLFGGSREPVPGGRIDEPDATGRTNAAPGAAVLRKSGAHAMVDAATLREAERLRAERLEAERLEAERRKAEAERLEAERLEAERRETERVEAERRRAEAERAEVARRKAEAERLEAERQQAEAVRAAQRASAPLPVSRVAQPIDPSQSGERVPGPTSTAGTISGAPRPVTTPVGLPVRPQVVARPVTPEAAPLPAEPGLPRATTAPLVGETIGRPAPAASGASSPFAPSPTPIGMGRSPEPRLTPTTPPSPDAPAAAARSGDVRSAEAAETPTAPQAAGQRSVTEPLVPGDLPMSPFGQTPSTSPGGVSRPPTSPDAGRLVQAPTPLARPTGPAGARSGVSSSDLAVVRPAASSEVLPTAGGPTSPSTTPRGSDASVPRPPSGAKPPPLPAAALGASRPTPPPLPAAVREALGSVGARPVDPPETRLPEAPAEKAPPAPIPSVAPTPIAPTEPAVVDGGAVPASTTVAAPIEAPLDGEVKFHDRLGLMKLFYDVAKVFVYTRDLRPGELLESSCTLGQNGEDFLGTAKRAIYHRLANALEQHIDGPVRAARTEMSADEGPGYELMLERAKQLLEVMRRAEPLIGQKPPERFIVGNTGRPKMSPEEESLIVEIDTVLKRLISTRAKVAAGRAA